ncbi:MAG: ftsH [Verrucomicrobiales bacterium]|nr:ftsH [Verrucomicrobiales bacterium]
MITFTSGARLPNPQKEMSNNENKPSTPEGPDRRGTPGNGGGDQGFNWKGLLWLSIALSLIATGVLWRTSTPGKPVQYPNLVTALNEKKVDTGKPFKIIAAAGSSLDTVSGYLIQSDGQSVPFKTQVNLDFVKVDLLKQLEDNKIQPIFEEESAAMVNLLATFLPLLLLLGLVYFFFRQQIKMAGRGAMSFGKSRAKMLTMDKNKITFKQVAGVDEAKEEVSELVEFLKDPKKFQKLGGHIPKGVLMVGSPGTGKTLLAKAIAGEADVPFFSISGSDFVEMFVGVGASRVRDMFEQGKKNAPCLIFIDEIDAVGRHRGHGMGGGHDEREQTLNALLVEMDGFDTTEGVIIIAATNRPDVLDPALLRPGRFDRQVTVPLPDVKGREGILKVHAKKVKMAADVDLTIIARGTPGYSGAELANVINEAALMAARRGAKAITTRDLEEARDKVRWGKERRSMAISEKEKETTAVHEAGHAILLEMLEHTEPLHKVTIIPRGPSLGSTMWLPVEDKYNTRRNELLDELVVIMGGRVAEEMTFGDVTSGASGDIRQATRIARKMVCEWGMSESLGMVEYGDNNEHVFLARDMAGTRGFSEETAKKIDAEIKRLIDDSYQRARDMLTKYRAEMNTLAKALLEYETLDGLNVREIMQHGALLNPPRSKPPTPPAPPAVPESTPAPMPNRGESGTGDLPPGLAGAPA